MLVDVVRCAGVALGLWGAWLTAPSGAQLLAGTVARWFAAGWRWVLSVLPWRRSQTIHAHAVPGGVSFGGALVTDRVEGWAWLPDAPVGDRVELLRERTEKLAGLIRELRGDTNRMVDAVRAELSAAIADHGATLTALRSESKHREDMAAVLDAAGLPVIGVAIVLSGLPDQWVRLWPVGLPLLVVAVVVAAAGWVARRSGAL